MAIFKWLLLLAAESIMTDNLPSRNIIPKPFIEVYLHKECKSFLFFSCFFENSWSASSKKQNPMYCIVETNIKI